MTTKEINQSMECIYDRPYVTAASLSKMEDRDWFFFEVTVDLGASDDGNGMSTFMSKKYDTYDDAVIAMNEHLEGVHSPV